ncbi:MAG: hypothetical protein AB1715_14395, partial [Acidobacteriota bacterium]
GSDFLIHRLNRILTLEARSSESLHAARSRTKQLWASFALALGLFFFILPAKFPFTQKIHQPCAGTEQAACCLSEKTDPPRAACLL